MVRYSFPVGLFHSLLHAGLSRRTPRCLRGSASNCLFPSLVPARPGLGRCLREPASRRSVKHIGAEGAGRERRRCPNRVFVEPWMRVEYLFDRSSAAGFSRISSTAIRIPSTSLQSPSRGGHLRGACAKRPVLERLSFSPLREGDTSVATWLRWRGTRWEVVSVPFARGTPPWRRAIVVPTDGPQFQSPSRGGHLRGTQLLGNIFRTMQFQSPSRGGHLRGCSPRSRESTENRVSVPFATGKPPWRHQPGNRFHCGCMFQFPSRGRHLRGNRNGASRWSR
jgi:hypothetical protein